ncbi:MAG: helix-turn-helix transcriptional regulator [Flavobacteriales bacterium]|nr:helix-turn-helix transcriptional regulator [Flavobacteriales bacterium]
MGRLNRIKEWLVIRNISQKELAAKLDTQPNAINKMCNIITQPHIKDLKQIADVLEVGIRDLLVLE